MAFFHPFCTAILLLTDNHHRSVYPPQTIFRKAADSRPPVPENSFLPAGRCDDTGFDKDISEKKGINAVQPGEIFEKGYQILVG